MPHTAEITALRESVAALGQSLMETQQDITSMKGDLKRMGEDMQKLLHVVRDGNGRPSLLDRVLQMEHAIESLQSSRKLNITFWTAIGAAAISGASIIISTLLK